MPVIMARASSSRGSNRVIRDPGEMDRRLTSARETSRVTGIGKRTPFARRRSSTTLKLHQYTPSTGTQ